MQLRKSYMYYKAALKPELCKKIIAHGLSKMVKKFANACGKIQTGYLYHYAFAMLIGLIGFLSWYLYK